MSLSGVYIVKETFNIGNGNKATECIIEKGEIFLLFRNENYRGMYHFHLEFVDKSIYSIYHKYQTDKIKQYCEKTNDYPELLL